MLCESAESKNTGMKISSESLILFTLPVQCFEVPGMSQIYFTMLKCTMTFDSIIKIFKSVKVMFAEIFV